MCDFINLTTFSALFGLLGLTLDIWGVWKLFSVEPEQIKQVDKVIFDATLGGWTKEDKNNFIINALNEHIENVNFENKRRSREAKKYRKLLIWGFLLQSVSVILAFLSSLIL